MNQSTPQAGARYTTNYEIRITQPNLRMDPFSAPVVAVVAVAAAQGIVGVVVGVDQTVVEPAVAVERPAVVSNP